MFGHCKCIIRRIFRDDRGASATEYAVIIVALILVVLATIIFLEEELIEAFNVIGFNVGQFGKID